MEEEYTTVGEFCLLGIKKELSTILKKSEIIDGKSVGQLIFHINNGGITKICKNNWEIR